jgi:hypothetical protein
MARIGGDDTQRYSAVEGFLLGDAVPILLPQPDIQRMPTTAWFDGSHIPDHVAAGTTLAVFDPIAPASSF